MSMAHEKLARIIGTSKEALLELEQKMGALTGQHGVLEMISKDNDTQVDRVLKDLGLSRSSSAEEIYNTLTHKLIHLDQHLFELLDKPDLSKLSQDPGKIRDVALEVFTPPKGFFIKKEKVASLLDKYKPQSLLDHFGYQSVQELLDKQGFAGVVSALRFTQTTEWMHQFFETAYNDLKPEDFEDRDVEVKILDQEWLKVAEKFLEKKFHNVSHLKEFGVIFIIPLPIDTPGETLRMFTLLLHYLHEVPFYTGLFRKFIHDADFIPKFQSLLRGDVPEGPLPTAPHLAWRIVQRYLAKDDPNDFRLHEHHVNPEAEHWYRVADDYTRLARVLGQEEGQFNIGYWHGLDHVGDFFVAEDGSEKLVSFDIIDLIMSLVKKGEIKYLYHQQEALWNKIFSEYMGHEQMNSLIEDNIVGGFIEL
ncbi:hypothetical protein KW791_02565 [Candidatus Parcubacteria bacterium]|nr:hypothetical protein [Candidatus Parcubacteria bacterium]